MAVDMMIWSETFQHFGAVEGILWIMIVMIILTLRPTAARPLTWSPRKEPAAYSPPGGVANHSYQPMQVETLGQILLLWVMNFLVAWYESCNSV
jgi:hypothetical protein